MKFKMNHGCIGGGKKLAKGKTYESPKDVPEKDAVYLVNTKAATEIKPKGAKEKEAEGVTAGNTKV